MRSLAVVVGLALALGCGKTVADPEARQPSTVEVAGAKLGASEPRGRDHSESANGEAYVIKLQRTVCYGVCPAYTLEVNADGEINYNGERYVGTRGAKTVHVPRAAVSDLVKKFSDVNFMQLTWKDPCPAVATDNPTTKVTFVDAGRARTIEDYHGNSCMPKELRDLEDEVDRVAGSKPWTTCKGDYCMK